MTSKFLGWPPPSNCGTIGMYAYVHIHAHTRIHIHIYIYTHIYLSSHLFMCMYVYIYTLNPKPRGPKHRKHHPLWSPILGGCQGAVTFDDFLELLDFEDAVPGTFSTGRV